MQLVQLFNLLKSDYDIVHAHAFLPGVVADCVNHQSIPSVLTVMAPH